MDESDEVFAEAFADAASGAIINQFLAAFPFGFSDHYDKLKGVTKGNNSFILNARNKSTNKFVTLKLYRQVFKDYHKALFALRDVKYLSLMSHPNVVKLTNVSGMKVILFTDVFIEMERLDTDLKQLILDPSIYFNTDATSRNRCMLHILSGLAYIHSAHLVHRNLKPSHILFHAETSTFKIADFTYARTMTEEDIGKMTKTIPYSEYSAPELVMNPQCLSSSIDIYSAGLIFVEIITMGPPLFVILPGMLHIGQILKKTGRPRDEDLIDVGNTETRYQIYSLSPAEPYKSWSQIYNEYPAIATTLMDAMLQFSSSNRITAAQALDCDYIRVVRTDEDMVPHYAGPPIEDYSTNMILPRILNTIRKSITKDISTETYTNQLLPLHRF